MQVDEDDLESLSCGSCYMGLNIEHLEDALRGPRCDSPLRFLFGGILYIAGHAGESLMRLVGLFPGPMRNEP